MYHVGETGGRGQLGSSAGEDGGGGVEDAAGMYAPEARCRRHGW